MKITRKGYFTITGPDGTLLLNDQGDTRQTTTRDEAYEYVTEDSKTREFGDYTYTIHPPEYEVGLTDAGITEEQDITPAVDQPPTIISTPLPLFNELTAADYDLTQHVSDDGVSTVNYTLTNPLPNGLSLNEVSGLLSYDGIASDSVSAHALVATDAAGFATSSVFNITISGVDAFNFLNTSNVTRSSTTQSPTIVTISGLTGLTTANISVDKGEYRINGGSWTSLAGTVSNGDTVEVRHTASGSYSTPVVQTITIGGEQDTFTSTTEAAPGSGIIHQSNFNAFSVGDSGTQLVGSNGFITHAAENVSIVDSGTVSLLPGSTKCVKHLTPLSKLGSTNAGDGFFNRIPGDIKEGEWLYWRQWFYFPSSWNWGTGGRKGLRLEFRNSVPTGNRGHWDIFLSSGTADRINPATDPGSPPMPNQIPDAAEIWKRDEWFCIEQSIFLSDPGIWRIRFTGTDRETDIFEIDKLVGENTTDRTIDIGSGQFIERAFAFGEYGGNQNIELPLPKEHYSDKLVLADTHTSINPNDGKPMLGNGIYTP